MNNISIIDLIKLLPNIHLIDIRDKYQYDLGTIPSAVNIPMTFLITNPENYLIKEETYYIICQGGHNSQKTCYELVRKGYKVVNVIGGYNEYRIRKNNVSF